MKKEGYWIKAYILVPSVFSWREEVLGAQGQPDGPRFAQLWEELKRLPEYIRKGDLCSLEEGVHYLLYGRASISGGVLTASITPSDIVMTPMSIGY
jgi:hypothetical protein